MAPIVTHYVAHRAIMQRYRLAEGPIWDGVNNRRPGLRSAHIALACNLT